MQLADQLRLNQEVHSESLQNLKKSISAKKGELQNLMTNFAQLKDDLNSLAQEKSSIDHKDELVQLEQLRSTLDETLEQSQKAGEEDLAQLEQTVGSLQVNESADK